jgi:methionyl-tRNA formyltransferase
VRVAFLGTPETAATCLRTLVQEKFDVVAVLTRPDSPKGRHLQLTPSPVKTAAVEANLPVLQFDRVSSPKSMERLRALDPDTIVVVAFGEILSDEFLKIPKTAIMNVHFSLLPKYRGAAPVHWALIRGEKETGVTVQHLAKKLDTGDIILQEKVGIAGEDTAQTLTQKLAKVGAELLVKALRQLEQGTALRVPQEESQATYARKLTKDDGEIDWRLAAEEIVNQVRGMSPWPGAYTFVHEKDRRKMLRVSKAKQVPEVTAKPGEVVQAKETFVVAAGNGAVELLMVQLEGKKPMQARDFLRGHHIPEGTLLI